MASDKSKVAERLSDLDIAYLAGLIDGEGCFVISHKKHGSGKMYYHAKLVIGMCGDIIPAIHKRYKIGTVYFREPQKENWKGTWIWTMCKNDLWPILGRLIPLLMGKAVQANAVLQIYENQGFHVGRGKGSVEGILETLREANRKGVSHGK